MSQPAYPSSDPDATRPGLNTRLTFIVALLSMLGPFSIDAYLPSFPDIEATFGISRAVLSQSLSIYLTAFAVSTLLWGPLSDRFGRRLVVMVSLSLYVVASIGCALAGDAAVFIGWRTLQGFTASGGMIAGRAMIRDAHDAKSAHRAMAQVTLVFAFAPAIAPVLGAWLHDHYGWRSVFGFLGLFGVLLIGLTAVIRETLPETQRQSVQPRVVARVYARTLQHHRFPLMILSLGFTFAGIFLYIAGAPTVIYNFLGLGTDDFGVQFIPMVAGLMLGAFASGRLSHRVAPVRIVGIGFGILAISVVLNLVQVALFETTILFTVGPLVIYAIGTALIMPAVTILALDCFPHHRGTAASMQGFAQMLINAAVAGIAVPALHLRPLYFVIGQALFLSLALVLWYVSRRRLAADREIGIRLD
jgi:DHA1 family bicyclomycin/chloramphenicol resistance-like MFS transporter